jgi:L-prolyl-PCP dehydrogenase
MDFDRNEEQREICGAIEELSRKKLNENVFADDEAEIFPREKWNACGETGIFALPVPQKDGGMGASMLTTALAVQALGRGCIDEGLVFSVCAHLCTCVVPLMLHGTPDQKRTYLEGCAQGRIIGGNGSSEAAAGSDIASMRTRVERDGDRFILNGSKLYVSNGTVADILIMYAKHPHGMNMADISAFVVERSLPGIATGQVFKKMGLRTCPLCEIVLTDCKVPAVNLLGRERFGMRVFNDSMLWERIIMAAYHIGSMEQQFGFVLTHATNRKQFGKRIIDHQEVSGKIVDMKLGIETSKLLLYKTASDYDRGSRDLPQASLLKYHASESKVKNSLSAVQILGAGGYIKENPVEKQLRDSIAATIYSGTSEIQKKIIVEGLLAHG